jgi:hypothetical protein
LIVAAATASTNKNNNLNMSGAGMNGATYPGFQSESAHMPGKLNFKALPSINLSSEFFEAANFKDFTAGDPMSSIGRGRYELNSLKLDFSRPVAGFGCRSAFDDIAVVR